MSEAAMKESRIFWWFWKGSKGVDKVLLTIPETAGHRLWALYLKGQPTGIGTGTLVFGENDQVNLTLFARDDTEA
jgi:hypothetical protein